MLLSSVLTLAYPVAMRFTRGRRAVWPFDAAARGKALGMAQGPDHQPNNPVGAADPTEWPDPYDHREDPRDPEGEEQPFGAEIHPPTGSQSTSDPNPKQDPEAQPWAEGPKRDKLDE